MKRARKQEEKDQRRGEIVREAWRCYQQDGYNAMTMSAVAAGVGLAKGTLYLYFPTKESLLLEVLTHEFRRWFAELQSALERATNNAGPSQSPERLAGVVADSLAARPNLLQLLAESHVILEQHADEAAVLRYKTMIASGMEHLAHPMARALGLPSDDSDEGATRVGSLLQVLYALTIGLWSMTRRSPIVETVMDEHPELEIFRIDFAQTLRDATSALFLGMHGNTRRGT